MHAENKLSRSIRRTVLIAATSSVLALAATSSMAAIVCGPTNNLAIPANIDGVYLNLVTGATGIAGGSTAGWDINLYQTGTPAGLFFFWPTTPAASFGGTSTATVYDVLTSGASIGPASTFIVNSGGGGAAPYVNWQGTTQTGKYLGIRFFNESTSTINYAWLQLNTTATTGFPATISQYCYQTDGTAITAGTTPVSLQSYSVD
ncbi:MAG: hypothetical protein ABI411_06855 [Tahibacter sp.]